jgi:hypothetical protein
MTHTKAIIGNFTVQNIQQMIDQGQKVICLEYTFTEVPENVFDVLLGYTSKPYIKAENNEDEAELLDQLHDTVERELRSWIKSDIYVGSGGVVEESDLKEGRVGFYFERSAEKEAIS